MISHYICAIVARMKNTDHAKLWWECEAYSYTATKNVKGYNHFKKTLGQLNIHLPCDVVILLLANQVSERKQIGSWGCKEGNHKDEGLDYTGDFMGVHKSKSNCIL